MVTIKSIKILSCFLIISSGCVNQLIPFSTVKWKDELIVTYYDAHQLYESEILPTCFDHDRDMYFDMMRKLRAINEYPLDNIITELSTYLNKNNIDFDSIYMHSSYGPFNDELDKYESTHFYVFNNTKISLIEIQYLDEDFKIHEHPVTELKWINAILSEKSGCGYGYSVITRFNKDFDWTNLKFVINPDSTM